MAAMQRKLNYLGMDCAPSKSTFGDALNKRNEKVFDKIYFALLAYFAPLLSDSLKEGVSYEQFFAFETLFEQELSEKQAGVMKVEHIHSLYKEGKKQKTLCLRKVTYRDEKGRFRPLPHWFGFILSVI
jgi:hypothetical protein